MANSFEKLAKHAKHLKVDGLPHIVRFIHPLSTIVWTALLIGNAGVCVWLIITSCHHYNEHMVSTTVRVYHERESVFPSISICNMNPLTNKIGRKYLASARIDEQKFNELYKTGYYGIVQYIQSLNRNQYGSFLRVYWKTCSSAVSTTVSNAQQATLNTYTMCITSTAIALTQTVHFSPTMWARKQV